MPILNLPQDEITKTRYTFLWALLALQSGYLNTFGFLASGRYVSHITGISTQIGTAFASQEVLAMLQLLSFPVTFIIGAFVSGFLTTARAAKNDQPRFVLVAAFVTAALILLFLSGHLTALGRFADSNWMATEYFMVLGLVFVSGVQNSCFTVLTKGFVRTTHVTGTATDLGTDLAALLHGNLSSEQSVAMRKALRTRGVLLTAFSMGALFSAIITQRLGNFALVIPIITSLIAVFALMSIQRFLKYRTLLFERESNSFAG